MNTTETTERVECCLERARLVVGSRLTLNPLVILVSLFFWFWIWGIIGALLTVPLLISIKIVLGHLAGREVAAILD